MEKAHPPLQNGLRFSQLASDVCNLLYERNQDKNKINGLIDQLNALNYKSGLFVTLHDAKTLITAICLNVKPSDSFLVAKAGHIVNNVLSRQNLQLSPQTLGCVIAWDLACFQKSSKLVFVDILNNLQTTLHHNASAGREFINDLIGKEGILINLIKDTERFVGQNESEDKKLDIILLVFKCFISLTAQSEDSKSKEKEIVCSSEMLENITHVVINFLFREYNKAYDEFIYCKVAVHALRILSQIYLERHEGVHIALPEVIGLSKHFLLYGLVASSIPQKLAPSQQTIAQPVIQNARGGKKQKVRKQRNGAIEALRKEIPISDKSLTSGLNNFECDGYKPVCHNMTDLIVVKTAAHPLTSDSDMSDAEGGRESKLIALKTRVRQSAFNLLLVIIKVSEKRDMFGYWWALLPDSPDADKWSEDEPRKRTLAYCSVNDPMSVCRASSLSVVLALLSGSRIYLSQAEMCKREITSFTPFSIRLGHTISCLHKVLCSILESERIISVVLVALKCCAALVQATPYHRMQEGLITEVVKVTRRFLLHRDSTLQVAALVVTGCVLSVDPSVEEIVKSVLKDNCGATVTKPKPLAEMEDCEDFEEGYSDEEDIFTADVKQEAEADSFSSWVLDVCFKNLGWVYRGGAITKCKLSTVPLMLESLQVISAIAFHHFPTLLRPHIKLLADVFVSLLDSHHAEVVLQTCKTISSVADAILKLEQSHPGSPQLGDCMYFWEHLLSKPLPAVLQADDNPAAKAMACDCVANIGERVFKDLSRRLQVVCVTLLSGSCGDEEAAVRAAAVRALAVCALYHTLREDAYFVSDCGESVLRLVRDPALTVRVKAAWSLGNLSDALALNMKDPEIDTVDDQLLIRLLEASVQAATENEKIKMSATRAIGNLLRLLTEDKLRDSSLKQLAGIGLQRLVECASKGGNMKLRWNACYALGNAIKNNALYTAINGWQKGVLSCLCTLIQDCKNLKVRITAATALRSPLARAHYSVHLHTTWSAVIAAMEAAHYVEDYTEYKHKDKLVEELSVTLAHLCCMLSPSDLQDIVDPLSFHLDCAKSLVFQVSHKLPPEHESCLKILEAAKYVTVSLSSEALSLTDSQRQALAMLQDLFIWDT